MEMLTGALKAEPSAATPSGCNCSAPDTPRLPASPLRKSFDCSCSSTAATSPSLGATCSTTLMEPSAFSTTATTSVSATSPTMFSCTAAMISSSVGAGWPGSGWITIATWFVKLSAALPGFAISGLATAPELSRLLPSCDANASPFSTSPTASSSAADDSTAKITVTPPSPLSSIPMISAPPASAPAPSTPCKIASSNPSWSRLASGTSIDTLTGALNTAPGDGWTSGSNTPASETPRLALRLSRKPSERSCSSTAPTSPSVGATCSTTLMDPSALCTTARTSESARSPSTLLATASRIASSLGGSSPSCGVITIATWSVKWSPELAELATGISTAPESTNTSARLSRNWPPFRTSATFSSSGLSTAKMTVTPPSPSSCSARMSTALASPPPCCTACMIASSRPSSLSCERSTPMEMLTGALKAEPSAATPSVSCPIAT